MYTEIALWSGEDNTVDSINGLNGTWNPEGADAYATNYK
jgi:hypothetical protein